MTVAPARDGSVEDLLQREERYDALCFLDATDALRPLPVGAAADERETFPSGV